MKRASSIAAIWIALLAGSSAFAAPVMRIELHTDRILASDLARAIPQLRSAAADAVLDYAPLPGIERRVSRGELFGWADDLGLAIDASSLPEAVILARKMRRLESSQVYELLIDAVADRYQVDPAFVEVEIHSFSEPLLTDEPLEFELAYPLKRLGRPTTLTVRWTNPQGRSGSFSFRATAKVRGSYAVARHVLAARTELHTEDFTFTEGFLPGDPGEYAITPEDIEGKQLRQSLKAGASLERRMLEAALTVERGDLIELCYRSRAVVLRAAARAEQSGAAGEVIRCRNLQSGASVRATILDATQAEVVSIP